MKYIKLVLKGLLLTIIFASCEEVIFIDVNQAPAQVVIDAVVTDEDTIHRVRITLSGGFDGSMAAPITDAIVGVSDNLGNVISYTHNPEGYDSLAGYYFSDQRYSGVINRIYQLDVSIGNTSYQARDTLRSVTTIDSLSFRIDEHAAEKPDNEGEIYQLLLYADEPQETIDFYYFKFYRDSVLEEVHDVYVFDDVVLGGSLNGLPSPVLFKEGELATVEIYGITRSQFVYFLDLNNILNSDGGMFSPPPANPRSNITGGALGLFQVSSVSRRSILIEP